MEGAMEEEWRVAKGVPLPGVGLEDRRLLFAAIARGVLAYLKTNQNGIFKTITFEDISGQRVMHKLQAADLDINSTG
jgi:hypothetical protein